MQPNQTTCLEDIHTAVFFHSYFPQYMTSIQKSTTTQGWQGFTQWMVSTSEARTDKIHGKVS